MLDRRQFFGASAVLAVGVLASCASPAEPASTSLTFENPWVRTTDGATNKMMTAAFGTVVNPGDTDVKLVGASCEGAGLVELHQTVERDGKKVMEPVPDINVPAGRHLHLTPGGWHIMLMKLQREFKLGEEVSLELKFSTGQIIKVTAPAKQSAEEDEHYHPGDPTPGQSSSSPTPTHVMPSAPSSGPMHTPATSTTTTSMPSGPTSRKTGRY